MTQPLQDTPILPPAHSSPIMAFCRGIGLIALLGFPATALNASEDGIQPIDENASSLGAEDELVADRETTPPKQTIPDIPVAPNVDLKAPAPAIVEAPSNDESSVTGEQLALDAEPPAKLTGRSIVVLDTEIPPATSSRLSWGAQESFDGIAAATPVLVVNGAEPGPVMCVTAAVHGDELNGIEMVRSLLYNIDPNRLKGTLIGVPIVNLDGFRRNSRYLTDRRDLNRFFPGNPNGSAASRIAHSFFNEVILHCEVLVDLHTGSFHRSNLPQLRADLKDEDVRALAEGFGGMVVLHSKGAKGTLRRAATRRGIPTVTLEAGEPLRLQKKAVNRGVKGLRSLLSHMEMYGKRSLKIAREPHYYKSQWVRADQGGVLFAEVSLGERVKKGELLGTVTDPITNVRSEMLAPANGRILGMALNQVLMPGFATFRIGIETSEQEILTTQTPAQQPIIAIDQDVEVVELAEEPTLESSQDPQPVAESESKATVGDADRFEDTDKAVASAEQPMVEPQTFESDASAHELAEEDLPEPAVAQTTEEDHADETATSQSHSIEAPVTDTVVSTTNEIAQADSQQADSEIEQIRPEDSDDSHDSDDNKSVDAETALVAAPTRDANPTSSEATTLNSVLEEIELVTDDAAEEDPDYPVAEE